MSESPDSGKSSLGEKLGGAIALGGFVLTAMTFGHSNSIIAGVAPFILYMMLGAGVIALEEGLRTGKLIITHGHIYRHRHPGTFRFYVGLYLALIATGLGGILLLQLDMLLPG